MNRLDITNALTIVLFSFLIGYSPLHLADLWTASRPFILILQAAYGAYCYIESCKVSPVPLHRETYLAAIGATVFGLLSYLLSP